MKEIKLLPCPFCGSSNVGVSWSTGTKAYKDIALCNNCEAQIKNCESTEEAIKKWNTRAHIELTPQHLVAPDLARDCDTCAVCHTSCFTNENGTCEDYVAKPVNS